MGAGVVVDDKIIRCTERVNTYAWRITEKLGVNQVITIIKRFVAYLGYACGDDD